MKQNNIKSFSEFLRMATFFLINNKQISSDHSLIWKTKKVITKKSILDDPQNKVKLEVMNELKALFVKGGKLLKKIDI